MPICMMNLSVIDKNCRHFNNECRTIISLYEFMKVDLLMKMVLYLNTTSASSSAPPNNDFVFPDFGATFG